MKKLMKKIKSNKLLPKLVAILTICMVLMSSLTVSAFAADDEASAANEETGSILGVFTEITDSIMSLLGTAQGVFFFGGSNSVVLNSSDLLEGTVQSFPVYFMPVPSFDYASAVQDQDYSFSFLN